MSSTSPLIVLTGGGTAGPVTPLLAVATAIRAAQPDARFLWIGTSHGPEAKLVAAAGIPFVAVHAGKLRRYADWRTIFSPFETAFGFLQAVAILAREPVKVVVSAGGFVAAPVIWAAAIMRLPVHVHQQDVIPTLTNVLTAPFAASVTVAFEKSAADFHRSHPVVTGNPVRPQMLVGSAMEAQCLWGLEPRLPTVLVLGGGTGSASINDLLRGALYLLTPVCQVIHVAGVGKMDPATTTPNYHQFDLLTDDLAHAFAVADVVVTRAGLGTLSELAVLGKPTIVIPIAGSHQEANAKYFADQGAAITLDERETFSKSFADVILDLLADVPRRHNLATAIKLMNPPDAAAKIAAAVLKLVK